MTDAGATAWGARSMTAPLREVLVHRPDPAFGAAFDNPAHGFRHPVDLEVAHAEHDVYTDLLAELGVRVHRLVVRTTDPDLVYTFDPALMTDAGAVLLRPGKTNRQAEPRIVRDWLKTAGVPIAGRIGPRATIEGGDVLWLRPNLLCVGISPAPTRRAPGSWLPSSTRRSASSTCPIGAAPTSWYIFCRSSPPSPTTWPSSTRRSCPSACGPSSGS